MKYLMFFLGVFLSIVVYHLSIGYKHVEENEHIYILEDSTIFFEKRIPDTFGVMAYYYIRIDGHLYYIELAENKKGEMYMEHCIECECKKTDNSKK